MEVHKIGTKDRFVKALAAKFLNLHSPQSERRKRRISVRVAPIFSFKMPWRLDLIMTVFFQGTAVNASAIKLALALSTT